MSQTTPQNKLRLKWDDGAMVKAVTALRNQIMGLSEAARHFDVPKWTLKQLARETHLSSHEAVMKMMERRSALPDTVELDLINYLHFMKTYFYGYSQLEVRRMAYQVAKKHGIDHYFCRKVAGISWASQFIRRRSKILNSNKCFRQPKGLQCENVNLFYNLLEEQYKKFNCTPDRIWCVDKIALSMVQSDIIKTINSKNNSRADPFAIKKYGPVTTVVCAMNAAGLYFTPMLIFPFEKISQSLVIGAPRGSIGIAHPSGCMQPHLFIVWLKHFIAKTKPTKKSPVLLIVDGHHSYMKNIEFIDLARDNHVIIISLPYHSSDKLQPLKKLFMRQLWTDYCNQVVQLTNNKKPLGPYNVAELFGNAYHKCMTQDNAVDGFKSTGIWPLNRINIVEDDSCIEVEKQSVNTEPEVICIDSEQRKIGCSSHDTPEIIEIETEAMQERDNFNYVNDEEVNEMGRFITINSSDEIKVIFEHKELQIEHWSSDEGSGYLEYYIENDDWLKKNVHV
ncbi:hypothetical protein PV328_011335 [Microctonus aethiopoides]|uniref:DDE-1 domain-containing protein n=1 Tax=Microctonus aethiopoides TaxID=144406 RepID=A0AA39EXV5_9HYME|nr:hypothetical protein PV328_011335 [Microctonus aethiopoides]